jgi:hypothetical protein
MEKSAGQARIFDNNDRSILSKSIVKQGSAGWHGVPTHQTHIRTCDLELPRGLGTVKCGTSQAIFIKVPVADFAGKFFEVRYFLNVVVSSAHTLVSSISIAVPANFVQQAGNCPVTHCAHTHGSYLFYLRNTRLT